MCFASSPEENAPEKKNINIFLTLPSPGTILAKCLCLVGSAPDPVAQDSNKTREQQRQHTSIPRDFLLTYTLVWDL